MATKVDKAKPPAADTGADDLEVPHPERIVTVAGRTVTVREYGFLESLRMRGKIQPLLQDLYTSVASGTPSLDDVLLILADHAELVTELIALSIDSDVEFVANATGPDGDELMMVWWAVNGPFFLRNTTRRVIAEKMEGLRGGRTSTNYSSSTATPKTTSQPTPAAR